MEPFLPLHNAMYRRWNEQFDPQGLFKAFKAVVAMAPCFRGDQEVFEYWEVPDTQSRFEAVTNLAELLGLDVEPASVMNMLAGRGDFSRIPWGVQGGNPEPEGGEDSDSPGGEPVPQARGEGNAIMGRGELERCLVLQGGPPLVGFRRGESPGEARQQLREGPEGKGHGQVNPQPLPAVGLAHGGQARRGCGRTHLRGQRNIVTLGEAGVHLELLEALMLLYIDEVM